MGDSVYAGNEEVNGEHFMVEDVDDGPGAFRACLDVGLSRTSTGANVFGAMKGAADGGIEIPHSEKRFPGYDAEEKEFTAEVNRDRIFGKHVGEYMRASRRTTRTPTRGSSPATSRTASDQ